LSMSPMAYLKTQRLNQVRQQLKACRHHRTTVTDVAIQCGFWHMGQFAKDYRKMFGECPSETLRYCKRDLEAGGRRQNQALSV
jgi:AraC family ethanolamine operon transcriptional activator